MNPYIVKKLEHYCNVSLNKCAGFKDCRVIPYYDLTFVLSGCLVYEIDGIEYTLNKNDCLFLKPGALRIRHDGSEPVSYVSFNFTLTDPALLPELEPVMRSVISKDIRALMSVFSQTHLSQNFHSKEKCINLLNYILYELMDIWEFKSQNPHIQKTMKCVDAHIDEPLSLSKISALVNLSPEYLSALFKKETGKTLTEYINDRKLALAKRLILESAMPLSEIAESLGYENYNYFSRIFKARFSVSPKNVKKRREI